MAMSTEMDHVSSHRGHINTFQDFSYRLNNLLFIIIISLSASLSMNTRKKNKSKHPGVPDMTPSQLLSAGLSSTLATRRKKPTKDQQIAALKDELRAVRELISNVSNSFYLIYITLHLQIPHFPEPLELACGKQWPNTNPARCKLRH